MAGCRNSVHFTWTDPAGVGLIEQGFYNMPLSVKSTVHTLQSSESVKMCLRTQLLLLSVSLCALPELMWTKPLLRDIGDTGSFFQAMDRVET